MTIFDGSASDVGFNMQSTTLVDWASVQTAAASNYSYITDDGHDIDLFDSGSFTYSGSTPTGGTVLSGQIDFDDDDFLNPEIVFSGSMADLVTMTNSGATGNTDAFYNALLGGSDDLVTGSSFNDTLIGLGGSDTLDGGDGNDWIVGGFGFDTLLGGNGNDVVDYSHTSVPYLVDLATNTASQSGTPEVIASMENVVGTTGADTVTGSIGNNFLKGIGGADILSAGDGSDTIFGGDDDDVLTGGKGFDLIFGDEGNDVIRGNAVADTLKGLGGDDVIIGGGGIDDLEGGDGLDVMRGNQGFDDLDGGNDNDILAGRGGADTLFGADGDDYLTGKGGSDVYLYNMTGDMDTIRSFMPGVGGDVIRLSGFGAAFDTFAEVLNAATDVAGSMTIDFGGGDILVIQGVLESEMNAADFEFI